MCARVVHSGCGLLVDCFTISSTEHPRMPEEVALDGARTDAAACFNCCCAEARIFAVRVGHRPPPRCSMMSMASLECLSCSMEAIICVVRRVIGGSSTHAARTVTQHAEGTPRGSRRSRFVKALPCGYPTRADDHIHACYVVCPMRLCRVTAD